MVMEWELSVNRIDKVYKAILNVTGQQTVLSFVNDLKSNDTNLLVLYNKSLSGTDQRFQKGDTLFILSKSFKGNNNNMERSFAHTFRAGSETMQVFCF
jgi:hypothetical protein